MSSVRAFLWLAIVFAACVAPAHAADTNLRAQLADLQKRLVMRVKRSAVDRASSTMSRTSASRTPSRRERIKRSASRRPACGHIDSNYVELLRRSGQPGVPADFDVTSKFAAQTQLQLPACLQLPAATAARPAEAEVWSEVTLKNPQRRTQVVNRFRRALSSSGQQTLSVEDTSEITLYSNLSQTDLDSLGACKRKDQSGYAAADCTAVRSDRAAAGPDVQPEHVPSTQRGMPVTIVIPNTGATITTATCRSPVIGSIGVGWTGNPRARLEGITPYPDQMHHQHGTSVASAALGGPGFLQLLDGLELKLRLAPFNTLTAEGVACRDGMSKCPQVRPAVFNNAVVIADNANAIVNLSVGRSTSFPEIEGALNYGSDVLFVVAAGNEHDGLDHRRVYPASYGGRHNKGQYNLITVAATDLDGSRAAFSNFGKRTSISPHPVACSPCLSATPRRAKPGSSRPRARRSPHRWFHSLQRCCGVSGLTAIHA